MSPHPSNIHFFPLSISKLGSCPILFFKEPKKAKSSDKMFASRNYCIRCQRKIFITVPTKPKRDREREIGRGGGEVGVRPQPFGLRGKLKKQKGKYAHIDSGRRNVLLYVVYVFYKRKLMIFHKSSDNKACSMSAERK